MSNIKNDTSCLVCKSINTKEIPYIDKPFYGNDIIDFSKLQIRYCEKCGFGFSIPEIESDLLDKFYSVQYRSQDSPHFINFSQLYKPKISQCVAGVDHLLLARQYTQVESGDYFLDIGPGPGWHFAVAQSFLNNPKLYAIESDNGAAKAYKRLYDVKTYSNYESMLEATQEKQFKFIISSHSLEHFRFSDLKILLNKLRNILLDEGVFVVEVPHVDMRIHSRVRTGDSPHLLFFSKESLKSILINCGYEVVFMETVGNYYGIKSDIKENGRHTKNNFSSLLRFVYSKFPLWFKASKFKINCVRKIKSLFAKLLGSSTKITVSQLKINYGGNRTAFRLIAKKKNY